MSIFFCCLSLDFRTLIRFEPTDDSEYEYGLMGTPQGQTGYLAFFDTGYGLQHLLSYGGSIAVEESAYGMEKKK